MKGVRYCCLQKNERMENDHIYKSACSYVTRVRVLIIYKETMQTKRRKMTTMAKQMNKECSMEWNPTRDNASQRQHNTTKSVDSR